MGCPDCDYVSKAALNTSKTGRFPQQPVGASHGQNMGKKGPETDRELWNALINAFAEVEPESIEEVNEELREFGVDAQAAKRFADCAAATLAKSPHDWRQSAGAERETMNQEVYDGSTQITLSTDYAELEYRFAAQVLMDIKEQVLASDETNVTMPRMLAIQLLDLALMPVKNDASRKKKKRKKKKG